MLINTGCLTPATVCAVNLEGTRLVFLSACRSGVGYKPCIPRNSTKSLSSISWCWCIECDIHIVECERWQSSWLCWLWWLCIPILYSLHSAASSLSVSCPFLARKHLIEQNEPFLVYASFTCSGLDLQLNPATATEAQNIQMVSQFTMKYSYSFYFFNFYSLLIIFKLNVKCR